MEGLVPTFSAFAWTVLVAMLPLPAEGPAVANALLFGMPTAIALTWSGFMTGAGVSFELARRGGRPMAERWLRPTLLLKIDSFAIGAGWRGLLGIRLIPAASFTGINWAAGLSVVERRTFYWTTAVGILPGCIAFTWIARYGASRLPIVALPLLGVLVLGWVGVRWAHPEFSLRTCFASMSPLALRFRVGAIAGVVFAAVLAVAAPEWPRERALASTHCPRSASTDAERACCRLSGPRATERGEI